MVLKSVRKITTKDGRQIILKSPSVRRYAKVSQASNPVSIDIIAPKPEQTLRSNPGTVNIETSVPINSNGKDQLARNVSIFSFLKIRSQNFAKNT